MRRVARQRRWRVSAPSEKPPTITIEPDLDAVRRFIADMLATGAVAALVTAIVLLVRMRDWRIVG